MKLIPLFVVCCLLSANATNSFAQRIQLEAKKITLIEALREIHKQSGYDFLYDYDLISGQSPVQISLRNVSVETAMDRLLEGRNLTFTIDKGIVAIRPKDETNLPVNSAVQESVVRGRVTDTNGQPLESVSVSAPRRGATSLLRATSTNGNGEFVLTDVDLNGDISFAILGYRTVSLPIEQRTTINVTLEESVEEVEDVVITGIYNRRAESFTGASMTIKKEDIQRMGSTNVFQSLRNLSPSMFLDNFDMGSNPNTMPNLQIRGNGSLPLMDGDITGGLKGNYLKDPSQPLFILDGFEASVERIFDLDINRIESVTILKDAASKAIYGSKAANGVIVIETTQLSGGKPLVTYNSSVNIELPDLTSYNLTNAREKLQAEVIDGMYIATGGGDAASQQVDLYKRYNQRLKLVEEGLDTYWLAKPLQNGVGHRHSLSVELGSEDLRVLTDLTYNDVTGAMIGSGRRNVGGNVSASYRVSNLLFRNITSFTSNKSNESPYGEFVEYSRMNPYWRAENLDGSIPFYAEADEYGGGIPNPLYNAQLNSRNDNSYLNFANNLYVEWMPIEGLRSVARFGVSTKNNDANEFYPAGHTRFIDFPAEARGTYQVNNGKSTYLSGDLNINYSKQIGKNYYFGNVGYNISEDRFGERIHRAWGFPSDRLQDIIFARSYALDSRPTGQSGVSRDMGFLTAFSYMWDDRFISDFTFRTNASSLFGADRRWGSFWSVGLGWNFHNEEWVQNLGFVDQFRVRGSIGETGNQNFNTNASISTYEYMLDAYYMGYPGSQLINMANPGLQWEAVFDYNGGLDLRIGPVDIRFDYYQRYTENLVTDITLPNSTGFNSVKDNLGKIKNSGIDLYSNYRVWQRGRNFVSLQFNIETNTNKIVALSNAMQTFNERMDAIAADRGNNVPVKKYQDGMAMDAIWAVPSLGIDPATGNEIYVKQDGSTTYNWSASDMIVAGIARPKYQGTFGIQAEYKGIGLSVTARYLGGGQLYNSTLVNRVENVDMNYNVDKRVLTGRWLYPGQDAMFKRLGLYNIQREDGVLTPAQEVTRSTTRFVQDRADLDIAAINVYYDFYQQSWLARARLQRLRAAFNMNEIGKFSTIEIERGLTYPFARTMSFSLTATF